ncbi:MAG: YbhB/YbcL family Raf kinase inhibitor-like protein [Pseudomonas sp.]|uniref:YbhB/YbcL family Raf kinase inhibitor-like protein n=1 Tax=Pseudomonas abieticivorans TaxID=2931382 RepID=UPI0020BD4BBA|nr:YbhB/YbcL family Raf kinase inhibitor-like protein [Pseudomonas sp. PIA16]MDE1166231.1 YbhB/YbcL family Raf kinase inhibitor-like protein [Pseudomonas sp.]
MRRSTALMCGTALTLCLQLPALAAGAFTLKTPDGEDNSLLRETNAANTGDCGGENVSPALSWSNAPAGTQSFALIMHDPDGQKGLGVNHWVHYGINASTHQLAADASLKGKIEGLGGTNSKQLTTYSGPCPPVGENPHHYVIQIYALDLAPDALPAALTREALQAKIKGHILANTSVVRRYGR